MMMYPSDKDSSAARQSRGVLAAVLLALVLVALAAWLGWQRHRTATEQPSVSMQDARTVQQAAAPASDLVPEAPISIQLAAPPHRNAAGGNAEPGLRWPLWEFQLRQPIPPRNPPLTPPTWRLIGATSTGGVRSVVILRQGRTEPEYVRTGDTLPGGYVVGEITDEDVTLIHDGKSVLLSYIGTR